jgi:dTMP kinase
MPRGFFITFEGLDGSGKTTQIKRLASWLRKHGPALRVPEDLRAPSLVAAETFRLSSGERVGDHDPQSLEEPSNPGLDQQASDSDVTLTRQPGGTETGDRIRALTLDSRSTALAPMAEMALMFADRAQAIAEVIEPALAAGKIVLCDRFTDSTEAYQGGGRELGSEVVLSLHRLLCGNLQPDLTVLLLPSLETSLSRARTRNHRVKAQTGHDESRFENEQEAFYRRVWEKYREIAARERHRVVLVEGDLGIGELHRHIVAAVAERLASVAKTA